GAVAPGAGRSAAPGGGRGRDAAAGVPGPRAVDAAARRAAAPQAQIAIGLQEAIEHRAAAFGVPVDARIERGRTFRHALRQTIANERYERIVVSAAAHGGEPGLHPEDVAWLLDNAPGDIVVLRPGSDDRLGVPIPAASSGSGARRRRGPGTGQRTERHGVSV
ncbi:MAG: hypothetical protein ACR2NR_20985, partial [Solirubrobacteraceae bacterium]